MPEWLRLQVADGFSGFSGTSISASVRMSQTLLNDVLAAAVKEVASADGVTPRSTATDGITAVVRLIQSIELHVADGAVVVNVEIRV